MKGKFAKFLERTLVESVKYPEGFDPNELDKLSSFTKRVAYCKQYLPRISSGSSRIVYNIDGNYVLKLARNPKGIAQNEVEDDGYINQLSCVANVSESSRNALWIVSQYAFSIKKNEFMQLCGIPFELFCDAMIQEAKRAGQKRTPFGKPVSYEKISELWNNEFFNEIAGLLSNMDLLVGDLIKLGSYGKTLDNHLVLRDAGFTLSVQKEHYS